MFNVCHSVQHIYEHRHHFQSHIDITPRNLNTEYTTFRVYPSQELRMHTQHYSSHNFEEQQIGSTFLNKPRRKKGIKVMCCRLGKDNINNLGRKNEGLQQKFQTANLEILKNVEAKNKKTFGHKYGRSLGNEEYRLFQMEQIKQTNEQSPHRPHALIKQQKYQLLKATPQEIKVDHNPLWLQRAGKQQLRSGKEIGQQEIGGEVVLETIKKDLKHDWRCSAKTNSNNNSQVDQYQGETNVGGSNLRINIRQISIPSGQLVTNVCKTSKHLDLLQEAKTIISREESVSLFSEVNVQESVLIQRSMGIFDFVTPVEGSDCCCMAKAIDNRTNDIVTIKRYDSINQIDYHHELEIMRTLESLKIERVLKLQQTMLEDIQEGRKMVFVYEPFDRTMAEIIRKQGLNNGETNFEASVFLREVQTLLNRLHSFGIYLNEGLSVFDFVWLKSEWRLRCVCKLRVWGSGSARSQEDMIGMERLYEELVSTGVLRLPN